MTRLDSILRKIVEMRTDREFIHNTRQMCEDGGKKSEIRNREYEVSAVK